MPDELFYTVTDTGPINGTSVLFRQMEFYVGPQRNKWIARKTATREDCQHVRDSKAYLEHWNTHFVANSIVDFYAALKNDGYWGV